VTFIFYSIFSSKRFNLFSSAESLLLNSGNLGTIRCTRSHIRWGIAILDIGTFIAVIVSEVQSFGLFFGFGGFLVELLDKFVG